MRFALMPNHLWLKDETLSLQSDNCAHPRDTKQWQSLVILAGIMTSWPATEKNTFLGATPGPFAATTYPIPIMSVPTRIVPFLCPSNFKTYT